MTSIENYRANLQFLKDSAGEYPHACKTKVRWPLPEEVFRLMRLDFICAPLINVREWRFRTEVDMKLFKQNYTTLDNRV